MLDILGEALERLLKGTELQLSLIPPAEPGKHLYLNQVNGLYFNAQTDEQAAPIHLSPASYTPHWAGFLAGRLWLLSDLADRVDFAEAARDITWRAAPAGERRNVDTGYAIYHSACFGYSLTGDPDFLPLVRMGAESLSHLYHPEMGMLMFSLPDQKHTEFALQRCVRPMEILIDTGEVLDLLWWAGALDAKFRSMAEKTVEKMVQAGLIREDGATYQCVEVDPETLQPVGFFTRQGYSDESVWARGQAWAMIFLATAYELTGRDEYLGLGTACSDWFIDHLPDDLVPFYDFSDPRIPQIARDSSAAAIAAVALSALSRHSQQLRDRYSPVILGIIERLVHDYLTPGGVLAGGSWGGLWREVPNEVVMPYGNYYLVEAIYREVRPDGRAIRFPDAGSLT